MFVTMGAQDARDLLAGALLAVSKDKAVPALCGVQVTAETDRVTVRATDRYVAVRGSVKCDVGDGVGAVMVPAELVARIVKATPKPMGRTWDAAAWPVTFTFDVGTRILTARWLDGSSVAGECPDVSSFPRMDALFPAADAVHPGVGAFAVAPRLLVALSKLPSSSKQAPLRFRFGGSETKPALVTVDHDTVTWDALVMPCRISA